jgi:hypothetical protein
MLANKAHVHRVEESPPRRVYSPELQPLLQSLLSTLADLDFAYEQERERLIADETSNLVVRKRALERLNERHHEQCEPYIRHLEAIQERIGMEMEGR